MNDSKPRCLALVILGVALCATPAAADFSVTSGTGSLNASAIDFFRLPSKQDAVGLPFVTTFKDEAEVDLRGHGSVQMHAATGLDAQIDLETDSLVIRSTQSFDIQHLAADADRQNLSSATSSSLQVSFCTTERATFLFSASGQIEAPKDRFTFSSRFKNIPFATASASANLNDAQFLAGVNVSDADGSTPPTSGSTSQRGVLQPGCYVLNGSMQGGLLSPLLCKSSSTPTCIPSDGPFNNPPGARGSFQLELHVVSSPQAEEEDITWVGPSTGAFDDPTNWNPQKVPIITDTESDNALFLAGSTIDVDLSGGAAAASAAVRTLAPRAAASRATGRLRVKRLRNLRLVGGNLVLDDRSFDKASLVVGGGSVLSVINGTLQARHAVLGDGGPGTVVVATPQSFFIADLLAIGAGDDGFLQIQDSGDADSEEVRIGNGNGLGLASVTGVASRWTTGKMSVGFIGKGSFDVTDGASVTSNRAFVGRIAASFQQPSRGEVSVSTAAGGGVPSSWDITNGLDVLDGGSVHVGEGGLIRPNTVSLCSKSAPSKIKVDGGELDVANVLVVGTCELGNILGSGEVALSGSGRIEIGSFLSIGDFPGTTGRVVVSGVEGSAADQLSSERTTIGALGGFGELILQPFARVTEADSAFVGAFNGESGLGLVELTGVASDREATRWRIVNTLDVGSDQGGFFFDGVITLQNAVIDAGEININPHGKVRGVGTLRSATRTFINGRVEGAISVEGDYQLGPSAVIVSEVVSAPAAPAAAGALTFARSAPVPPLPPAGPIVVTGNATLDGTLVLQFLNGVAPHQGDTFPMLDVQGTVSGNFANVEVRGLAPGAELEPTMIGGALALVAMNDGVALPTVSLKAKSTVKEKGKTAIKVTRTGDTSSPMLVSYTLGGTATNGLDYSLPPETIEIPAKKKVVKIVLRALADAFVEAPETVELEIVPGTDYAPSLFSKISIVILDGKVKR